MRRLSLAFKNFGIILSSDQLELFEQYLVLLHEWKSKVNLTSITEREKEKHTSRPFDESITERRA